MTHYFGYVKGCSYTGILILVIAVLYSLVFFDKPSKNKALLEVENVIDLTPSIRLKHYLLSQ